MFNLDKNNKTPLPPHKVGFWGRKRYSVDTNAADYNDYSFDDVWNTIGRLWVVVFIHMAFQILLHHCKKR